MDTVVPPRGPGALETCWNWRYELGGGLGALIGPVQVDHLVGTGVSLNGLLLAAAVLLVSPGARRRVLGRLRAVWVQHRLRVGFADAGLFSPLGHRPRLLWTRPTGTGERSWVWLPAGLTAARMACAADTLAAAAWAERVRVTTPPGRTHVVVLDIDRTPGRIP